eukprot:PhM_4_TR15452/c2_g1_i1/m.26183
MRFMCFLFFSYFFLMILSLQTKKKTERSFFFFFLERRFFFVSSLDRHLGFTRGRTSSEGHVDDADALTLATTVKRVGVAGNTQQHNSTDDAADDGTHIGVLAGLAVGLVNGGGGGALHFLGRENRTEGTGARVRQTRVVGAVQVLAQRLRRAQDLLARRHVLLLPLRDEVVDRLRVIAGGVSALRGELLRKHCVEDAFCVHHLHGTLHGGARREHRAGAVGALRDVGGRDVRAAEALADGAKEVVHDLNHDRAREDRLGAGGAVFQARDAGDCGAHVRVGGGGEGAGGRRHGHGGQRRRCRGVAGGVDAEDGDGGHDKEAEEQRHSFDFSFCFCLQ